MLDTLSDITIAIGIIFAFISLATESFKTTLLALLFTATSGILTFRNPIFLFFASIYHLVPTFVWIVIGAWIYLNAGWRFAEYKLRVAERWQTTHPVLLHVLWPGMTNNNSWINPHPHLAWFPENEYPRKISLYKQLSTVLFLGALVLNAVILIIVWLSWFATMGRSNPIHPEIWKAYRHTTGNIRPSPKPPYPPVTADGPGDLS